MNYRSIFDAKISTANSRVVFTFTDQLALGETISSGTTTAAVYSGTDSSPSSLISGSGTVSGGQVTQTLTGGTVGVTYLITCTAATSLSRTIKQDGYLTVKAGGT